METPQAAYIEYLRQYADFMDAMCDQAGERYHAMAALQSNVMQLEQMEARRMQMAEEAGFAGLTFRETLQKVSADSQAAMEPLFRRISLAAENVKFMNEKAIEFARQNLSTLAPGTVGGTQNLYVPPAFAKTQKNAESSAVFEAKF